MPNVSALLQDLYEVVDVALDTETPNLKEPSARYDLSRIDVSRLQAEFAKTPFKNLVAVNLIEKLQQRLAAMMARNPTRVDLYARYQAIVQAYNQDKDAAAIQEDEVELKAGDVFAHLYGAGLSRAGLGSGAHLYH